jgi:two-component system sensor histidine kinase/response regulator
MDGTPLDAAPPRLLLIEDSPSDAMLLRAALGDSVLRAARVERVSCLEDALNVLASDAFDAVLLDLGLPDSDGLDTFALVAEAAGPAAVVVVTGMEDARLAEEAVGLGAQDYLTKGEHRPGDIGRAVDYAIRRRRVLLELERARDEQLQAKDRFLTHVSHELRSPLSVVHQFGSLLSDSIGGPLTERQREFLTVLMRNVGQLKVLIDDLLSVSRLQGDRMALRVRPLALAGPLAAVIDAYRPTAEGRGVELGVHLPPLPTVVADPDRLHEVVGNLLENALKFTPVGGRVDVEAATAGGHVRVTVRDTGPGVRPGDRERIFEQFVQAEQSDDTRRNGLGLGLYVCRGLVERQGGALWVEDIPGPGAAFCFTLPIAGTTSPQGDDVATR